MPTMILGILRKYWKALLVVALCAGFYIAGSKSHPAQVIYQDRLVEKSSEVQKKTEQNNKVTTIVTAKDGTVTKTIVDHTVITDNTTKHETTKDTKTESTPAPNTNNYAIGLAAYFPATFSLTDKQPAYGFTASRRLTGDLWLDATYEYGPNLLGVGLRYDF